MKYGRFFLSLILCVTTLCAHLLHAMEDSEGDRIKKQKSIVLSVEDAIALAMAKNFQVKVSLKRWGIAEDELVESRGAYDPLLNATYGEMESRASTQASGVADGGNAENRQSRVEGSLSISGEYPWGTRYNFVVDHSENSVLNREAQGVESDRLFTRFEVSQPLLRGLIGNDRFFQLKLAKNSERAQPHVFKQVLMSIVRDVMFAYADMYFAEQSLNAAISNRNLAKKLVEDNRKRANIGRSARSDITAAQARLAFREDSVVLARQRLIIQRNNLALLISDVDDASSVVFTIAGIPEQTSFLPSLEKDKREAVSARPDIRLAELNIDATKIRLAWAGRKVLPDLSLNMRYSREKLSASQFATPATDPYRYDLYAGLSVSIPLFNRSTRSRKSISRYQHHIAKIDKQILARNVRNQIENAAVMTRSNWQRVELSQKALKLAEVSLNNEEKKLKVGKSNSFFVLNLQEQLASAQVRAIQTKIDYFKSLANYDLQVGRILSRFHIELKQFTKRDTF